MQSLFPSNLLGFRDMWGDWSQTRRGTHKAISHHGYGTYPISIKLIFRYPETKLRMRSLFPSNILGFIDMWEETSIHTWHITMDQTTIKLVYKYPEARLMMQSLSPLDLLGLGGMQGGISIHPYHTTNIICTKQQSNLFTSILRLDWDCKACPTRICWALDIYKEGHSYKHITLQI